MAKEKSSPSTPAKKSPIDNKHIHPNDLTVMEGAVRAVESFLATENAREAHLKIRVGFDLVPPEGRDYDYKSSSNLSIDISAVRNLPRAREDVLKRYEEEKKLVERRKAALRLEKQTKCPTSTRSVTSSTVSSSSANSFSDRSQMIRQPAGGDDSQSSSNSTAPTSPYYEGAKSALKDTMLMGTPHHPVQWTKLPDTPNKGAKDAPEKITTQKAIAREIPSATVFAVKGAGSAADNEEGVTSSNVRTTPQTSAKSIGFSPVSAESPMVQKRIENVEKEERRRKKEEEERKRKEEEIREKKKKEEEEERKKKEEERNSEKSRESTSEASEFSNDYVPKPKKYRRRKKKSISSIGSSASSQAAAAAERLRQSSGWITDLYHHYLLHVLASLGRAFPAIEATEPPSKRGQMPYPLQRAIRRALPSVEVFAVRHSTNVEKKEKKEEKEEKKEVKKEMPKKVNEAMKTAPTQRSFGVSPRIEQETTSKTAEEISSGRDTVSKREIDSPFKKRDDDLPSPIPTPTEQSIGVREVPSSHRLDDSSYIKDEDTLNNIKSLEDDDCYTKRTESDTSIISDNPTYPEASFDFRRVGEKRTEMSFQVLVHMNKIFSPIVPQPSRVSTPNLSKESL